MVITKATPADKELDLIDRNGNFNVKIKAYLCAAHSHCTGLSPQELADLYKERGWGLGQNEYHDTVNMVIAKFPITFQSYLRSKTHKKKKDGTLKEVNGHMEFTKYLYNRLYYMYYKKRMGDGKFCISSEHPLSQKEGSDYREYYNRYVEEFSHIGTSPKDKAVKELKQMRSVMLGMATTYQQALHAIDSLLKEQYNE
jgi:hypothetical protein